MQAHYAEGSREWFCIWGSVSFSSPFLCCSQLLGDIWQRGNEGGEELGLEKQKTITAMERDNPSVARLYPLPFNNYLIAQLTQDKPGLWLFPVLSLTCPAGRASGSPHIWDCFELQPQRLHLWKYSPIGCLCSYCDTKFFKSALSTILGNCKPVNNPVHPSWNNNSFKRVDMAISPLICTDLKTEEEILPLHLFIIKTLSSCPG